MVRVQRPLTEKIPDHLLPYIAKQDASLYTAIDHASWRYILRVSKAYFKDHAHQKYLDGLKETGISTERIPLIEEMDQCLRRFGWRAVAVSGFIPPAVFLEFQSLGIMPIACEMRTLEHLAYTPAPDIVHEAAGHAPIVADPEYAEYLRSYGEVSRKAIFSKEDMTLYEAIRDLSDIKEDPRSTEAEIQACQKRLDQAVASITYVSEAACLARMGWWTIEYGLVGKKDSKIYGAGLLSSVGESYHCLSDEVKKIPLSLACINTSYDITRPQPQLFVAEDFQSLANVLKEFTPSMAYKQGGVVGLAKALAAEYVATVELDSGVQISGVLTHYKSGGKKDKATFLKFTGPVQLALHDEELPNQGPSYHQHGFSAPIGKVSGLNKSPADLTPKDLESLGFQSGQKGKMTFESGIELEGKLKDVVRRKDQNLVLVFDPCTIRNGNETLYQPDWGPFDLACGVEVVSVFGGAADRAAYLKATGGYGQKPRAPKTNLTQTNRELTDLYARVRTIREAKKDAKTTLDQLDPIVKELDQKFPQDWLLRLEIVEINHTLKMNAPWDKSLRASLSEISKTAKDKSEMIARGLELCRG
ncbi:aromatic amino acid hydroxylase [bacterium]|jgi:phenylalanine-4-hydroxylase|nr:aromatic amino acid hydroxylase [bacterium]